MNFLNTCQDACNKSCYESHFLNGLGFNFILTALDKLKTFDLLNRSYLFYGPEAFGSCGSHSYISWAKMLLSVLNRRLGDKGDL